MIIIRFLRGDSGLGLGAFFVIVIFLLLGNGYEDMKNTIKYDTEWVDPKDLSYAKDFEVGESVTLVLKSKDSSVNVKFLMGEDNSYYKIHDCHTLEKKGKWYYYSISVTYVKEDPEQDGAWLEGISAHAYSPKLGHGMDMFKVNGAQGK